MTNQEIETKESTPVDKDDYDSPWKNAIEHYFPEFMKFYFPDAHAQIDWSKEYIFLDQELRAIVQDAELGKRLVDKLVRVTLLNGDEKFLYIHVEVQGEKQSEFPERMFVYNYRIYDRYKCPVASMAVLADDKPNWKPNSFRFEVMGCRHSLEFPIAKLTDYHDQLENLLASDNAFAIVTAAHIQTQRTRQDSDARFAAKRQSVRLLYERDWDKQRIIDLFKVIDWMMRLPKSLEMQLMQEIETIEESRKVQYVTSVERIGIEKGIQIGREEGKQEGKMEGVVDSLQRVLRKRFGELPNTVTSKINNASLEQAQLWLDRVFDARNLDEIFSDLPH